MSLINGYDAEESLPAAASMAPSFPLKAAGVDGVLGVMGLAFTTSLNSISPAYAFFASSSFTVDIRKLGPSPLTNPENALYTSIVWLSGTDAIIRPSAALMASKSAFDNTPC